MTQVTHAFPIIPRLVALALILLGALPMTQAASEATVGAGAIKVAISGAAAPAEKLLWPDGRPILGIDAQPWELEVDGATLTPGAYAIDAHDKHALRLHGETDQLRWELTYKADGDSRVRKQLSLQPRKDLELRRAWLWNATATTSPLIAKTSTGGQDIAAFYRDPDGNRGLFASLDFPWSRISTDGDRVRVGYPPFIHLKAGSRYECHSLTLGVTQLTGPVRFGYYDGEVQAMDAYVQAYKPPRFNRPMLVSASITNRWALTMKENPAINWLPDILKRDIDVNSKAGIEYYQTWPGGLDAASTLPLLSQYDDARRFGEARGVKVGDYSSVNQAYLDGYNLSGKPPLDEAWKIVGPDAKPHATHYCFGCPAFVDYYLGKVIPHILKTKSRIHCLDFLLLSPCYAKNHGHPAGAESLYAEVLGLVRSLEAINATSPEMMTWSNSGYWGLVLPKLAWHNHNLYLTDPYVGAPWQNLNSTRLLDDTRRQQMLEVHYRDFLPFRYFTNYQYFTVQNSIAPDIRGNYQFGALSTLAVTPNLGLGELRLWTDTLPEAKRNEVFAFYKRWTGFVKKHYDLWTTTHVAGEMPGPGAVEVYGHARGNSGYVFVVNPNYWSRTVTLRLDESLGFSGTGPCEVHELYPTDRLRLTASGPFVDLGTSIPIRVEAQQVLVLEVKPAPKAIIAPRLYGIAGSIEKSGARSPASYLLKTSGPQGQSERFAILLPSSASPITTATVRDYPWTWPYLKAPTPLNLLASSDNGILGELTFRRGKAAAELRQWRVKSGPLDKDTTTAKAFTDGDLLTFPLFGSAAEGITFPLWGKEPQRQGLGSLTSFCGAYVDNAPSEDQETWIDLTTSREASPPVLPRGPLASAEQLPEPRPLAPQAKSAEKAWWLTTTFNLPYQYIVGMEPPFDDHTVMALPFLDPRKVAHVTAWVNGEPLEVRLYKYPRNRELGCYYADLTGSPATGGENSLVLHLEFAQ